MADMQRMGDVLAHTARGMASRKLGRMNTTPARRGGEAATPEVVRARAAAILPHPVTTPTPKPAICLRCGGAGWERVAQISEEYGWQTQMQPCKGRVHEQERWQRARRLSDISDAMLQLTFTSYDATDNAEALQAAQAWATDDGNDVRPWLLLYGGMGTGKTHLLAAAFNTLVAAGRYPLYTFVPALLDHIRDGLDEGKSQEYSLRFQAAQQAPILILDDLGAERRTDWTDETLFKLLDYRYRQELPTAVASNLIPNDLEPRISSRLQATSLGAVVLMHGPDHRKRPGQRRKGAR